MIKNLLLLCSLLTVLTTAQAQKFIARQGKVAFFSYTPVENIKAENNQVLSIIDASDGNIAVSMLMNAFIFKKALMREHFNESYVESDIYPKATFEGQILGFTSLAPDQTRLIRGKFSMHGVTRELEIKVKVTYNNGTYLINGSFEAVVDDYKIKIPPMLSGNIAEVVTVEFRFEYVPYEE